jgi:hypothetical protein
MSNEIFSAPRDRALDPSRSIGSGPSMGPRTTGGAPVGGIPKFGGDPGFSRGKVNPPKRAPRPGGITKPGPYTGPIGGTPQTGPYTGKPGGTTQAAPYYPQG